jgi:hypothetical protein
VEANNSCRAEVTEEMKPIFVREADARLADPKGLFQQPTAEEVSRLVFAKLRDLRVHAQEARNHFAHLLNRGSSLE